VFIEDMTGADAESVAHPKHAGSSVKWLLRNEPSEPGFLDFQWKFQLNPLR
jgi:hypothetical protein